MYSYFTFQFSIQLYVTGPRFTVPCGSSTKKRSTSPFIGPLYKSKYSISSGDPPKCFHVHLAGTASAISATIVLPFLGFITTTFLNLYHSFNFTQLVFQSGRYSVCT